MACSRWVGSFPRGRSNSKRSGDNGPIHCRFPSRCGAESSGDSGRSRQPATHMRNPSTRMRKSNDSSCVYYWNRVSRHAPGRFSGVLSGLILMSLRRCA